jgi:hypothetical protein
MAKRPSKNVRSFFGHLNKVNTVILDAYQGYTLTPPDPVADGAGNITLTLNDFNAYKRALVENVVEFYILNQFRAALLPDLRRVINLQPMHSLDLDTAVRLATIELRSKDEARSGARINPVQQPEEEEDIVEAVTQNRQKKFYPQAQQNRGQQQRQNSRPQQQNNNYRNNQQQWRSNNPGNNSNRNKMTCSFCRKLGHHQEDCRKRINSNQPCVDSNGKTFWPKINTTETGAPIQSL